MTIIEQDVFDILIVRDKTMLGSSLPLQLFYLYLGLHLKVYLNYQQAGFKAKSQDDNMLDIIMMTHGHASYTHMWQCQELNDHFTQVVYYNLPAVHQRFRVLNAKYE